MDLFGKKKYEDRIKELETQIAELSREKDTLASQLEKREDKIRKLTSAYQDVNISLKAAEKKTAIPLTCPSKAEGEKPVDRKVQGMQLTPREIDGILKRLEAIRSPESDLLSAYIKDSQGFPAEAGELADHIKSDRGIVILHCPQIFTLVFVPPFPIKESLTISDGAFQLEQFRSFMETPALVISAHAGDTFLGLSLTKDNFEIQYIVESPVKEKHSKGGWSQKRFERLREEDIRNHADAVIQKLSEIAGKYRPIARYAVVCGDPVLLKMIMPALDLSIIERRIEGHDPKRLDRLLDEVYGFTLYRA